IMGEPLSPDRVFDFSMDEPKPHPAYDFFAPRPLLELMVDPVINELAEPIVEVKEQIVSPVMDMKGDLGMLFGDDNFSDDGPNDDKEVWEVNEEWLMAPVTPSLMPVMLPSSTYEYGHGQLVKKVSDAEMADDIAIGEIGPRVSTVEGQVQTLQATVQHRDVQIRQLQTLVAEISSREGTLMQCILGMDRRLVDLERRPLGPQ
nr:hypothetical protein [Tanacetum cinerariifolium]